LKNPPLKAELTANTTLVPNFVEEVLRMHAPIPHLWRVATADTQISGIDIPKGAVLQLSYLAGNYDTRQWACPDKIDIHRKGLRNHMAFGRGIHYCIGNLLARGEMRIAIRQLLMRLPAMRLSAEHPEPQFIPHFQVHALDQLNVLFD
jgi:cytochrome P450